MLIKRAAVSLILAVTITAVIAAATACAAKPARPDGKLSVAVSFNAMKEFTQAVGKDKVAITTLIPDGTEPHDFEPKVKDLVALGNASVFVYNGFGMESWAQKAVSSVSSGRLIAVDASAGAKPIKTGSNGQDDPHLWLSLKGAEIQTQNIRNALDRADPKNKTYYDKNCAEFVSKLESLKAEYAAKFQTAKSRNIVTGHAAFAYLCRDFGLKQNSVEDVFAEGEPSAQKLAELVNYCKKNDVKTVFVDNMVSPAVSRTLASQVGAQVRTIYTVESSEDGLDYLTRMRKNLSEIDESLSQ